MQMSKPVAAFLVALLLPCASPAAEYEVCGVLVSARGFDGVMLTTFPSAETCTVVEPPDSLWVESVASDGTGGIFFDAGWPCKAPYSIYHLEAGRTDPTEIRRGLMIAYSPASNTLYYHYDPADVLASSSLYGLQLDSDDEPFRIADAPRPYVTDNGIEVELVYPPIVGSQTEIYFLDADYRVKQFDSSTLQVTDTGIDTCLPRGYRASNDSLICYEWKSRNLYEVEITSANRNLIKRRLGPNPVYLQDPESILSMKSEIPLDPPRGEISVICRLALTTGESANLAEGRFSNAFWTSCKSQY
jgi:hypothetical protein